MTRIVVVSLALAASVGSVLWAAPQATRPAAPGAAAQPSGGAYYEFLLGLQLEIAGDNAGALASYERAARLDPTSGEIPAAQAELFARLGRGPEALAAGERAIKANPDNREAHWVLGRLYAGMAEALSVREQDRPAFTARAKASLERADAAAHPRAPLILARLYLRDADFAKAIALLTPFVAQNPEQSEAVSMLADAYELTNRRADALALLESAVADAPELYSNLGRLYEDARRWQDAADAPELYSNLGRLYEDAGRWQDAADAYGEASGFRPRNLAVRLQWAAALLNLGTAEASKQALVVLEQGGAAGSSNPRALYLLAESQRRAGALAAAETSARKLMAMDQNSLLGPQTLAAIFADQRQDRKIVELLDPLVTNRLRTGDPAKLSGDAAFRRLYLALADAQERLGEFDGAIATLTQAQDMSPRDPLLDIRLARIQLSAGRGDNAIATLQAAAAKFPDEPAVKVELGSALERRKRYAEAETVFRQVIAADAKNADALNSLGYMLAERGQRLEESVALAQRALALDPGNPAYLDSLGWAYYKMNRFELAEGPLQEASAKLPEVSVIQSHFGDVLSKRARHQDAIDAWQRALQGDGQSITRSEIEDKIRAARRQLERTRQR